MEHKRSQWASNIGFILAAAGSAVGLGNIWKFPGKVAAGGGGAFLICYALIVLFVGFPVMLAELSIGRSTQKNVVGAFRRLNPRWSFAGGIGVLTLFVIMSYYSVVGGWVMKYISVYLTGADFSAFGNDSSRFSAYFADFISRPAEPLLWGAAFLLLCIYVVVRGVSEGIERVSKFLMPGLFVLLTGIVVYAVTLDGAAEGLKYMLAVDPAKFNSGTVVAALGQAFFSLSINGAGMLIYGSYMKKGENILRHAGMTAVLDTLAALLAGFAILPAVFAFGIDPTSGPQLMFVTLPQIFQQMPGGRIFALLFFVSVFFAGITSLMNMLEACGEALTSTFRLSRTVSTLLVGAAAFLPGLFLESLAGMGGWMDLITIYVSPFGALLVAVCIYFVLGMKDIRAELALGRARAPGRLFGITARFYVFLTVAVWILGIAYGGIG